MKFLKKRSEKINSAKVAPSDGALGLSLILQAVEHSMKHGDQSLIVSRLIGGTYRDFDRLKKIIEISTNYNILGVFSKPNSIKVVRYDKLQTNDVFKKLKTYARRGDVSFRSKKLDYLVGEMTRSKTPNFDTTRAVQNLIFQAKAENASTEIIYTLERCLVRIKLLSQ